MNEKTIKAFSFLRILILTVTLAVVSGSNIDNGCINRYLKKVHLINEDIVSDALDSRNCDAYIRNLTSNFYKLWRYHYKYQQPRIHNDANIRCFVKESKKWQLHDRYLLDLLLRDKETNFKKIFQRNSYIYDRLRNEAENNCNLQWWWSILIYF